MKHFKCEQAYVHRRWLIRKLQFTSNNTESIDTYFLNETRFIYGTLSKKIKANYYCWTYLNWILEYLLQNESNLSKNCDTIILDALNNIEKLLYMNPSDFCIHHTRLNMTINVLTKRNKL